MNTFLKVNETLINSLSWGYFMLREFKFDQNSQMAIEDFMKTPYFCWLEEYRNEVVITNSDGNQIVDWNFHGLYDIQKVKPAHFAKIGALDFVDKFIAFIEAKMAGHTEVKEMEKLLRGLIDLNSEFYLIGSLGQEYHHDWTVYDFFLSGFKVNRTEGILTAIEFGQD